MSEAADAIGYRALVRLPDALYPLAMSTLGRLSSGMVPLSLLFVSQQATKSFSVAGLVLGAFGLATIIAPFKARLIDRRGQANVLGMLAVLYSGVLMLFAAVAVKLENRGVPLILLAALAGALAPPLGPSMRTVWASVAPSKSARQRAYTLDTIIEEGTLTSGPLVVGGLIAIQGPVLAMWVTIILAFVGTGGFALSTPRRVRGGSDAVEGQEPHGSPLRLRGFTVLLGSALAIGLALGAIDIAVAARADANGTPSAAGYLLAMLAFGSAIGGMLWDRRKHARAPTTHLALLLIVLATGSLAAAAVGSLVALAPIMLFAGAVISPVFIVSYLLLDEIAPERMHTEASTWVNTANNVGASLGAVGAGAVVDFASVSMSLVIGAGVLVAASILVIARRASLPVPVSTAV